MSSVKNVMGKIGDRLENRDRQTNFGTCRGCGKKVYWSSSKVASHIRSGHCSGATDEEVQLFKREYVYDTPKNLVHRTAITKKFKENFEIEEIPVKESSKRYSRVAKLQETSESKRTKIEMIDDYEDYEHFDDLESDQNTEKLEIVFLPIEKEAVVKNSEPQSSSSSELSREEKFIKEVYPQFKGKNKLDLINQILDLERLNEMLQTRAKTYENTINRLLN